MPTSDEVVHPLLDTFTVLGPVNVPLQTSKGTLLVIKLQTDAGPLPTAVLTRRTDRQSPVVRQNVGKTTDAVQTRSRHQPRSLRSGTFRPNKVTPYVKLRHTCRTSTAPPLQCGIKVSNLSIRGSRCVTPWVNDVEQQLSIMNNSGQNQQPSPTYSSTNPTLLPFRTDWTPLVLLYIMVNSCRTGVQPRSKQA